VKAFSTYQTRTRRGQLNGRPLSGRALKMGDQTTGSTKSLLVITGPPGSGKTPIVRELVASGFRGVAEPAREVSPMFRREASAPPVIVIRAGPSLVNRKSSILIGISIRGALREHEKFP
jgi:hypothetical protein